MTTPGSGEWVFSYTGAREYKADLAGVDWYDAPLPPRLHRCKVQTRGYFEGLVERCACGAIRLGCGGWMERNARRRG